MYTNYEVQTGYQEPNSMFSIFTLHIYYIKYQTLCQYLIFICIDITCITCNKTIISFIFKYVNT